MSRPTTGVVVVTHQSGRFIERTLEGLLDDGPAPTEIVVVDNGSTDETEQLVRRFGVRWHTMGENAGYGAAANAGIALLSTDVVAVINHDVRVHPGWLEPLCRALDEPGVGAAMPSVELLDQPGRYNTSGGAVAVTGMAWITDLGEPIVPGESDVAFPSGAAFAMRRGTWDRVGGMWSDLFLYHEDTDLGWRLRMSGLRIVRVAESTVAHDYDFSRTPGKLRLLERNRWMMLLANYRTGTLLALTPVLILHEAGVAWVALRGGWFREKVGSWREVGRLRWLLRERNRRLQKDRLVGDARILDAWNGATASIAIPGVPVPRGARVVDALTRFWVRVIRGTVLRSDRRRGLQA